jgi:hypothetical protein
MCLQSTHLTLYLRNSCLVRIMKRAECPSCNQYMEYGNDVTLRGVLRAFSSLFTGKITKPLVVWFCVNPDCDDTMTDYQEGGFDSY